MRTFIRAAGTALAALSLIHCGPGGGTQDAGPDGVTPTPDVVADTRPDTGTGPSPAGNACTDDTMCGSLSCDTSVPGGICTGPCMNNASQANEQMQCGGSGSTCLSIGDDAEAQTLCTKSCRVGPNPACRPGFVCTGFWYTHAMNRPDAQGCFPFCSQDSHCEMGQRCNTRTGSCQMAAPNPALIADGLPCRVPGSGQPSPCRGICFRIATGNPMGICGSFVNLATARECPDSPDALVPLPPNGTDNLGLCIFRQCGTDRCCPSGLVCEGMGDTGVCTIDDPMDPNIPCSPDGGTDGGTDASMPADSGVPTDSGVPADSGVSPDGGADASAG
jgi:hypothetical protein